MGRSCCDRRSGRRLAQDLVELVLECQLLLLQRFDDKVRCRFDARFHVPDSLVEFVVLVIEIEEMAVGRLELGNQVTVFGKHGLAPGQGEDSMESAGLKVWRSPECKKPTPGDWLSARTKTNSFGSPTWARTRDLRINSRREPLFDGT